VGGIHEREIVVWTFASKILDLLAVGAVKQSLLVLEFVYVSSLLGS
jgi:hypothetical protein